MLTLQKINRSRSVGCLTLFVALSLTTSGCDLLRELFSGPTPEQINLELVASGLTSPVGLVQPPDGTNRLFVLDQIGQIRIIENGVLLPTPFLDLSDRMIDVGIDIGGGLLFDERGLLGLAFHPDFATNGKLYVFYTAPKGLDVPIDFNAESHIAQFTVSADDPNIGDPDSESILLTIPKPEFNHNGGQLNFGPDGYLYISVGDGGGANDNENGHTAGIGNGQDKSVLLGKLLRIDVNSGSPYDIPADNPFIDDPDAAPEIFALGLRNPWRFSFDSGGTHQLFVADVGQDLYEEVNIVEAGQNYGWNVREGFHCFDPNNTTNPPDSCATTDADGRPLIDPIMEYPHTDDSGGSKGIAVIGGYIYRGEAVPGFFGRYLFGDFSTDFTTPDGSLFIGTKNSDGTWTMTEPAVAGTDSGRLGRFVFGLGQDLAGEVYVLSSENFGPTGTTGTVHRIVAAP
jgi:glucose/arabinose dehydrogenase